MGAGSRCLTARRRRAWGWGECASARLRSALNCGSKAISALAPRSRSSGGRRRRRPPLRRLLRHSSAGTFELSGLVGSHPRPIPMGLLLVATLPSALLIGPGLLTTIGAVLLRRERLTTLA